MSTRARELKQREAITVGEVPQILAVLFELLDDEMLNCDRRVHQILETEYQRQQRDEARRGTADARAVG